MSSWNDLLCQPPVDPRDVIAFCRLGGVEGVWALSSDYNQPAGASVWVPSPVVVQTESLVTTNGADQLQNVFDAQSWNQMHRTVNVAATVAPPLVIYGALDTDGPAFRVRCTKSTEFSRFLLSPVRMYQNARSTFNALLLVDGATHFRWIQAHDDVGKVSNFERERERNLILDEPDDMGTMGRVFYYHDLILRSYATYIYRMLALNQPDYEQCFVNPEFQIPELSVSTAPSKVVNQIHRYASSRLLTSLNRTGDVRPSYRVRNMVVTRKVVADGVEQTSENRGLRATSTLDIDQSRSLPFFDLDLIVVEGRSIDVSFTITPGLRVTTADVLYAQISVLSPDASLYDGKVDVRCEMTFGNGGTAAMPVMEESLRRRRCRA